MDVVSSDPEALCCPYKMAATLTPHTNNSLLLLLLRLALLPFSNKLEECSRRVHLTLSIDN